MSTPAVILIPLFTKIKMHTNNKCLFTFHNMDAKIMRMNFKITVIILILSIAFHKYTFSEGINIEELKKGKVITDEEIVEGRSGGVKAIFWVNAEPGVVFRELSDGRKFSEFMPDIDVSTVKNSGDNFQDVYYRLHFWFGDVEYTLHRVVDRNNMKISWNLLSGRFKKMDGYWLIENGGDGTVVTYYTVLEPKVYVPHFVTVYLTKKGLPELIDAVRRRAESDGKWRKRD
jgi:ribosome-associated toxin RatA of RatAB toxin-antitoxin module